MSFTERANNVYCIDGKMWGFKHYMACYVVQGKELALIDTGESARLEDVKKGIKDLGFNLKDFSYIFITHGHQDHAGNVAPLLEEMPKAKVYIHPAGKQRLEDPASINWAARLSPAIQARRKEIKPVPPERIQYLKDGDEFDLGDGEKLKIMFTPGHQPSGIVIFEKKNNGLFINDLVGNCFLDADCQYVLNPLESDNEAVIAILKNLVKMKFSYLYMGHYGITNECDRVMNKAIKQLGDQLEIGKKYVAEGKPELIAEKVLEYDMPELKNLLTGRPEIYNYATIEHVPFQSKLFAKYCENKYNK
jgi:glyoxylase-like metal-dependent hydrolase (beta-lactamase superfamily II)